MTMESQQAFNRAIAAGVLSTNPRHTNYAGNYMYMGASAGFNGLAFKHVDTREYIHLKNAA